MIEEDEQAIAKRMRAISEMIKRGGAEEALRLLRCLQADTRGSELVELNSVGFLIDIGVALTDPELIRQAIAVGERLMTHATDTERVNLSYNLANGHSSLFQLECDRSQGLDQLLGNHCLQRAKSLLRDIIPRVVDLRPELTKQVWVNYGNCLDGVGRTIEALDSYDQALAIDPCFAMALGNKGIALCFFADVSGVYRSAMYVKGYQMLEAALGTEQLDDHGGVSARHAFELQARRIAAMFEDQDALHKELQHPRYAVEDATAFEQFYLDFCSKHRLFLNLHVHEEWCKASVSDPVFISLVLPADDNVTFYHLARQLNQIKEDYAAARLLLVQSQFRKGDLDRISSATTYADTPERALFNIYVGLLKSAFRGAYGVLDKVAVFLNEYYGIGLCERAVQFHSTYDRRCIWARGGVPRPEIRQSENISLYALYDVFLDFDGGYYARLRDIRNALAHRTLLVRESYVEAQGASETADALTLEEMVAETVGLLQLARSCVIYLINCVQLEESRNRDQPPGTGTMVGVDTTPRFG